MTRGERIKKRRLEIGLSAEELGDKIGKTRATIYRYENGDIEDMPITILEPLASALNTTPAYLMGWESTINGHDVVIVDDEDFNIITSHEEQEVLNLFNSLNSAGKSKARDYLIDLTEIPSYNQK